MAFSLHPVGVADLPTSAADAVRQATVNERSPRGRLQGSEGQKVLLRQYARQVDAALRPVLAGRDAPLILAATEPLASIFRSVATAPGLAVAPEASLGERLRRCAANCRCSSNSTPSDAPNEPHQTAGFAAKQKS